MSFTATKSTFGLCQPARTTLRPMRPKPLMPTFTAIFWIFLLDELGVDFRITELGGRHCAPNVEPAILPVRVNLNRASYHSQHEPSGDGGLDPAAGHCRCSRPRPGPALRRGHSAHRQRFRTG